MPEYITGCSADFTLQDEYITGCSADFTLQDEFGINGGQTANEYKGH